jgi:hypothetical protein
MDNDRSTGNATWNVTVSKKPIIGKETLTDPGIWVLGACMAVILVILVYTAGPGPSRPERARPVKRRTKRHRRPRT